MYTMYVVLLVIIIQFFKHSLSEGMGKMHNLQLKTGKDVSFFSYRPKYQKKMNGKYIIIDILNTIMIKDIQSVINKYLFEWEMRDGVDINKISWKEFSSNNNDKAVDLLLKNQSRIDWWYFSRNNNDKAVDYLVTNQDKIKWGWFSGNNNDKAVDLLLKNTNLINWNSFSGNNNDKAVDFLLKNQDKIDWFWFSGNNNDKAVDLLLEIVQRHPEKINCALPKNSNTRIVNFLLENLHKIGVFCTLTLNSNDEAVDFLLNHQDKISSSWVYYNTNRRMFDFLLDTTCWDEISWKELSGNPNIFEKNNKCAEISQ